MSNPLAPLAGQEFASEPVYSFLNADVDVDVDFFSPAWSTADTYTSSGSTDPSPALSSAFDFSSCDATPLLDIDDAPLGLGEYAMPLFGAGPFDGLNTHETHEASIEGVKATMPDANALLQALVAAQPQQAHQEPQTVSGSELLVSPPSPAPSSAAPAAPASAASLPSLAGIKRRATADELLPLDAPVQARHYASPSSTSRKEVKALPARKRRALEAASAGASSPTPAPASSAAEAADADAEASFARAEATIASTRDPVAAKRLSNTLAARRSRHRKAEELRVLHETIERLKEECEMWKGRCERLEREA